jgi:ATP-binding cassette subfamily C protein PrsD
MMAVGSVQRGWLRRQLLARNGFPLAALFVISLVSNLLMLTGPIFMLQVYDRVLTSRSLPTLVALTLLVVVLYSFYALVEWLRARMATRFAGTVDEYLAGKVFRAGVRLRLRPAGTSVADPVRDLDALRQFIAGPGPLGLFDLPWLPAYLALVFLFHPLLGWLATAGAVVITVLLVVNELLSRKPSEDLTRATTRRTGQSEDARLNAEPILAMGMLNAVTERWRNVAATLVAAQHRAADWTALHSSVTKAFRFLLQSAVLALGAYLVIAGEITSGLMIAASIVTSRALAPVEQVVGQWRGFLAARQALRRIGDVLERLGEAVPQTTLPRPHRNLVVRQLAAAPSHHQQPIVSGIDFALEAGEGLGILGLSGSGKTSIARAIVGVWPVLQGTVRLDGSELSHYHPEQLGAAVGYLPQVVDLFDGTVAENISRFDLEASSEKILRASAQARTHELIASLPQGYDTQLGPRGAVLSAGQRQRIGLARALYGDPFLVVLDEPNSNLDQEGDAALTKALLEARERGAVVVVVAHRPSAVAALNKLLYVQGGRQAAFGPKDQVLRDISQRPAVGGHALG